MLQYIINSMPAKKLPKRSRFLHRKQQKWYIPLGIFILVVVLLFITFRLVKKSPFVSIPAPTPTPSFLASGKITYTISSGGSGPKIMSLILDDHNPKPQSIQRLEVATSYDKPVDSVYIRITSDNKERVIELVKKQGSADVWVGSWQVDDSILYKDIYTITAVSGKQQSTVITAPRS